MYAIQLVGHDREPSLSCRYPVAGPNLPEPEEPGLQPGCTGGSDAGCGLAQAPPPASVCWSHRELTNLLQKRGRMSISGPEASSMENEEEAIRESLRVAHEFFVE